MIHIARYAHLESPCTFRLGETIEPGQRRIARMGNTGKSTAAHVHFDLIQRDERRVYRLSEIPGLITDLPKLMQQYRYFLDLDFFGVRPVITTYFGDPRYAPFGEWQFHPGYDLVPEDRTQGWINWNRSKPGEVVGLGFDTGYGYYLQIKYEA